VNESWREVGDGVLVRRHESFDLNVGLVVGPSACLVIDTRATEAEGRDLAGAVRAVTSLPWVALNTHAHYDHCFGNAAFRPAPVWAHRRCRERLAEYGEVQRLVVAATSRKDGRDAFAADIEATPIDLPDRLVDDAAADLDVGGRRVVLRWLGRAHTDNDVVVQVPDAGVVFAGDLVEEGAPPAFGDSFPLEWPGTLDALRALVTGPVVPGHGDVVDAAFVEAQRAELAATAGAARAAFADGRDVEAALGAVPFPPDFAREALTRAYRQLRGDPAYDGPADVYRRLGLEPA
jgi:glyoxylase-like metal-dependent hydrolase (beta-lactamase superfamily II)